MSNLDLPARGSIPANAGPLSPVGQREEISACWNEIGVHGDGTCRELPKYIRCRNCPVYASAGTRLLDRPTPPEFRREWNSHFARERQTAAPRNHTAVIFRINAEWLALPTEALQEVTEWRPFHSLPHRQRGIVLGVVNVRGELCICVTLGHLLGLENLPPPDTLRSAHRRLLVSEWSGTRFVFPVDEVCGIRRFDPEQLEEPPATLARSNWTFTRGILRWEEHTIGLLDPNLLFGALNRSLA